ncbi:alpha-glucosidase [Ruminococcaceae bacterium OttesenSCG-928-A16]|nr:alpha-glucosidase [Ruminococcaceae bacterium OttesenSCG-928-A16]
MITRDSTLKQVYAHPVGKDILDILLRRAGRGPGFIQNPVVGRLTLSSAEVLLGKLAKGKTDTLVDTLVRLMNQHDETLPAPPQNITHKWWKEAVVYQIYPRSFQDSNGDGIGDLAGIRQRIPYLKQLGVDVVWLSPIYDSPNDDMGYDIRNYQKIMKEFGNMASFTALVNALHKNGIKLMMDLVVNHTSDEHEWFTSALQNPEGPTKDYYLWAKGKTENEPPNNWTSFFSGPAWNYYEETGEHALHLFSKKQMDLNWDNPNLRHEIYSMMNWWLDKGVDGFRMDVITLISKDPTLPDGNELLGKAFGIRGIEHYFYGPRLHQYLQEMRRESFGKYDVFTVGETPGIGMEMSKLLTAEERGELDLVFNFDAVDNPGQSRTKPYVYDLRYLKPYLLNWQQNYGNNCWPSLFFENHDNPRMPSKVTQNPAYHMVVAKLLAVLQFTLKGTPFLYQGQELGMANTTFNSIEDIRDVEGINYYHKLLEQGVAPNSAFAQVAWGTRDHARTPMQWSEEPNAGFTTGTPWLAINPNYLSINAKKQTEDPDSVFGFYKQMIALRKQNLALVYGAFNPVFTKDKNTFCYFRTSEEGKFYVEVNLTETEQKRPGALSPTQHFVAGNYGGVTTTLRPYEANVYQVL